MEDKCQFCRNNLRKKTISLDLWRKEKLYVFKNVPAKVCDQCNVKYFSSKTYGEGIRASEKLWLNQINLSS